MVPLLITMDLEIANDHNINEQRSALDFISSDFSKLDLPLSIFLTSDSLIFNESILKFDSSRNAFGIHGVNHSSKENYSKMKEEDIRKNIDISYSKITNFLNKEVDSFRGPFMSTSSSTQKILLEKNFRSDFSVCPQRIDIINSKGGDIRWLFSPRTSYHPCESSPFKKGKSPLWIVPLSCLGAPFISSMLYIFGLGFMKLFFKVLLKESLITEKPIVYLFHSYEFAGDVPMGYPDNDEHGKSFLHRFYISDVKKRYELNISLIRYMLSFDNVYPLNSSQYINFLERSSI